MMNKQLPIILVVVLIGCGGEVNIPIESCPDSSSKYGKFLDYYV